MPLLKSPRTVLLTGGRAPATLDLARFLSRSGHRVLVAESVRNHLSRYSSSVKRCFLVPEPNLKPEAYVTALKKIIHDEKVDCLIPTCEEIFFVARGRDDLGCPVWVDHPDKLAELHNKWRFNQMIREFKTCTAPESRLLTKNSDLDPLRNDGAPIVLKPVYSRFASQVRVCPKGIGAFAPELSESRPWIAQEFVSGMEICSYSLCYQGAILSHVCYSHEFTAGLGAGVCFEAIEDPKVLDFVAEFVKKNRFTGQIAFDFIRSKDGGLVPLECNPRATSGIHLLLRSGTSEFIDRLLEPEGKSLQLCDVGTQGKIGLAMILYGLPGIRSGRRLSQWLKVMSKADETVFSWKDMLPFFGQFRCFGAMAWESLRTRTSILDVSVRDIHWDGEK
jgi:glutathione synthase/RimK-type ligase-like ATP-grasp enzyme